MKRQKFLKKMFQYGTASGGFILAKGAVMAQKKTKSSSGKQAFKESYLKTLFEQMEARFDEKARCELMVSCGSECAGRGAVTIAKACEGDVKKLAERLSGIEGVQITPSKDGVSLQLLYPLSVEDTMDPQLRDDSNMASAILYLGCAVGAVLFTGDAQISTLTRARDYFSNSNPITCHILVVPHHGGKVARGRPRLDQFRELYTAVIRCDYAVVSVATDNSDNHPLAEHIQALAETGAHVLCTQVTPRCCSDSRGRRKHAAW